MKTVLAAILALGLLAGTASARTPFDRINDNAPRSVFTDIQNSAPRSIFDQIRDTAPRSPFEQIQDTAPRTDGVYGTLQDNAP